MPGETQHSRRDRRAGGARQDALLLCAVVALCAAVVAGFAWTRPTRTASVLSYTQSGRLSYSAAASPRSIYGRAGLMVGQPIYFNVVDAVDVGYAYRFETALPTKLTGTEQLVATISNGQGISRTLPLSPVTAFTGESSVASGTLNLAALQAVAHTFDQASRSPFQGNYTVGIAASVKVHGTLDGAPVSTMLDQPVNFTYSSSSLVLTSATGTTTPTTGSGAVQQGQQLNVSAPGSVSVPGAQAATLFVKLPVFDARVGSLAALAASLLLGWLLGHRLVEEAISDDERHRIAARHGSSLVEADELPTHPGVVMVKLNSFEGLRQVARRLECPILHQSGDIDIYAIVDNGTLYQYQYAAPVAETLLAAAHDPELVRSNDAADGRFVRS